MGTLWGVEPEVDPATEQHHDDADADAAAGADAGFTGTIVALGASAGGLDALDRFFAALSLLDEASFVVVQHLAPDHKTMMDSLLARHTTMPVSVATEGTALEGGHVYVIPPGATMTVSNGRLRLAPRPSSGVTLPIDAFFESLATEAASRSIAIVMSGTGSDGTRGAVALHEAGGWVMVQDPRTAGFDGMPRNAIATGAANHVLSPEMLAAEVTSIVASGLGPPPRTHRPQLGVDESSMAPVLRMLADTMRIDFAQYKPGTIIRRVERRMEATGAESVRAYADLLGSEPSEIDKLRRELLIPVTRFFRDPEAFAALRAALDPMLRTRADETDRPLRCWVTPCSTGEEAYSIAMVLLDLLNEQDAGLELKMFATDVEAAYLDRASAGLYTADQLATVPVEMRDRWFEQLEVDTWRARPAMRQRIVFSRHDLLADAPFTQLDLVSCRNLLIYFRTAAQDRALRRISFALRPGGLLLLGTSETPGGSADDYDVVDARQRVYRLRRRPGRLPPDDLLTGGAGALRRDGARRSSPDESMVRTPSHQALEVLSHRYSPPSIVITADRQLVHVVGDVRELLRIGPGDTSLDVLKLLPAPLTPVVATLVHAALREYAPQRSGVLPLTLQESDDGSATRNVRVAVWPLGPGGGPAGGSAGGPVVSSPTVAVPGSSSTPPPDHLLVCFEDAGAPIDSTPVAEGDLADLRNRQIADLERELVLTRANLHETIQDLGTANEELQATNEELMAANEELQSTNEELQSVNEELHTVNAEHQSKIVDLNEANSDLESLTQATRIPLVFVDSSLRLTRFTPAATALFRFRQSDVGRPITDFRHELDYPDLYDRVRAALADIAPLQREVNDSSGQTWLVTVLPYTPSGPEDARVVITCVDVSSMRDVRRLQGVLDALPEHVAVLDPEGVIVLVNRSWRQFAELNGDELLTSGPGADYLEVCRTGADLDPDVVPIHDGIREVLDGTRSHFAVQYPCHSADEHRWFLMQASPMAGGGCVVTHINITGWIEPDAGRPVPGAAS